MVLCEQFFVILRTSWSVDDAGSDVAGVGTDDRAACLGRPVEVNRLTPGLGCSTTADVGVLRLAL